MKKILYVALTAIILCMTSCAKKSPAEKTIEILDDCIEQIKSVDSAKEVYSIMEEAQTKLQEIEKEYPDYKPTPEEEKALQDKAVELMNEAFPKIYGSSAASVTMPDAEEIQAEFESEIENL